MSDIKYNRFLNEQLFIKTLPSGIKCYIISKKGYIEKQAVICTHYGSIDNTFIVNSEKQEMPAGIAHFLEHKIFENETMNVFDEFSKRGASVNAFTNFTATAYYFTCIDNFDSNLRLLMDFVSKPYITDENVKNEKNIIKQEIDMYEDNPDWEVYFQMLRGMYHCHPAKENIAGTENDIQKITKDMLYECYNTFYRPENMAIICVGDVNISDVCNIVSESIKKPSSLTNVIKREYGNEPPNIKKSNISKSMHIAMPLFCIGFKETRFDTEISTKTTASKILLDIIAGESSDLYSNLYEKGLIDENFTSDYSCGVNFGHTYISGASQSPEYVFEEIIKYIDSVKSAGISESHFERIKKKHIGRFVRGFNYIDAVAGSQVDYFTKGFDIMDMFSSYKDITLQDVIDRLHNHLTKDNAVLSIIN